MQRFDSCQKGGEVGGWTKWVKGRGEFRVPVIEWINHKAQRYSIGNLASGIVIASYINRWELRLWRSRWNIQSCCITYYLVCQVDLRLSKRIKVSVSMLWVVVLTRDGKSQSSQGQLCSHTGLALFRSIITSKTFQAFRGIQLPKDRDCDQNGPGSCASVSLYAAWLFSSLWAPTPISLFGTVLWHPPTFQSLAYEATHTYNKDGLKWPRVGTMSCSWRTS